MEDDIVEGNTKKANFILDYLYDSYDSYTDIDDPDEYVMRFDEWLDSQYAIDALHGAEQFWDQGIREGWIKNP